MTWKLPRTSASLSHSICNVTTHKCIVNRYAQWIPFPEREYGFSSLLNGMGGINRQDLSTINLQKKSHNLNYLTPEDTHSKSKKHHHGETGKAVIFESLECGVDINQTQALQRCRNMINTHMLYKVYFPDRIRKVPSCNHKLRSRNATLRHVII